MKPYGLLKYSMSGCCPGHDELPRDSYNSHASKKVRRRKTKICRRHERRFTKMALIKNFIKY